VVQGDDYFEGAGDFFVYFDYNKVLGVVVVVYCIEV